MKQPNGQIMVFDALDTIQGYEGAAPGESKAFYQDHLAKNAGMPRDEFLARVPYKEQLYRTADAIVRGALKPIMLPGAQELLEGVRNREIIPVVVTADEEISALLAVAPFLREGLIEAQHVYGINHLGKKTEATTWEEAKKRHFPLAFIRAVFEDTEANLLAALTAYRVTGFMVEEENKSGLRVVKNDPPLSIAGNLHDLTGIIMGDAW